MGQLVGVREAAKILNLNASTVSRYLRAHPELNLGEEGRAPRIDVEELRAHRAETVNHAKSQNHAGALFDEGDADQASPGTQVRKLNGGHETRGAYAEAKARREDLAAQKAQMELDEKRGLLVPRREVEDAAAEAGHLLQRGLMRLALDQAEPLATMTDPGEIRGMLEENYRQVLQELQAQLRKAALDEDEETDAAA